MTASTGHWALLTPRNAPIEGRNDSPPQCSGCQFPTMTAEGRNSWPTCSRCLFFQQLEVMNFSRKWKSLSRSIWKRKYMFISSNTKFTNKESWSVKWCVRLYLSFIWVVLGGSRGFPKFPPEKTPSFRNSSNKRSRSFWAAPGCARRWGNSWRHASHGFPGK